jgi:hypothetical protein
MGPLQDSSEPTSFLVEPAQKANEILGQPLPTRTAKSRGLD